MAESWNVAVRKTLFGNLMDNFEDEFIVLENGVKTWAADPFIFEKDGKVYVFAELYDYILCRGTIGYCEYNGSSKVKWRQIIVEPFHMSFPFIFEKDNEIYIMPETSANKTISLYKAVNFPNEWEKCNDLLKDDILVDTVLFDNYGFTYEDYKDEDVVNHLWLCENTNGKLKKRKKITNDIEYARMAGSVFKKDGKMYRPSQNCVGGYGKGLNFVSFSIDGDEYNESIEKQIFPEDLKLSKKLFLDGMHTYNSSKNYEVIDIKTKRFNIINFVSRIIGVIKR